MLFQKQSHYNVIVIEQQNDNDNGFSSPKNIFHISKYC